MQNFIFYKKENHLAYTKIRPGETKLGEKIQAVNNEKRWRDELKRSSARFVIIGIPEDIGVKANFGTGGTHTAWPAFLSSFLNVQHCPVMQEKQDSKLPPLEGDKGGGSLLTQGINGENIFLLGYFDFAALQESIKNKPVEFIRDVVRMIDKNVSDVVQGIVECGKTPIIIGGGHNNAYGNIKGAALGLQKMGKARNGKINVINLDAHADFRALEGRHSGNGFSYAMEDGYLNKYSMIGLHENYMPQSMLERIQKNKRLHAIFYEDIFIREKISFRQSIADALEFTRTAYAGIEIDLDAVENVLSSAATPSGFTPLQARQFLHQVAPVAKVAYLHICEGAAELDNGLKSSSTGKLISYLVSDFIKAL